MYFNCNPKSDKIVLIVSIIFWRVDQKQTIGFEAEDDEY